MSRPLTVSMTPAFYQPGDMLLRAQLRCLSEQTAKDFTVLIVDHHFSKRKGYMGELADKYKLEIVHVPYMPNPHVAKKIDCQIFNAPYCYSESPRIVRYSCWRFVRPDFTKVCLESPTNVDFRFHSIEAASPAQAHPDTRHNTAIWDMGSDVVNWNEVPTKSGQPGATWGPDSDTDEPAALFRKNCYGNYCVSRKDWLSINGCEEAATNSVHYEDMDFCIRARNAGLLCSRKSHTLYRFDHLYGSHSGRANIPPDHEFKTPCPACETAYHVLEPNRFDIQSRVSRGEIELLLQHCVWVCKTCTLCGPIYSTGCHEHTNWIEQQKIVRSNIISKFKLGRNLRILTGDLDGKSLPDKVKIFNGSYSNPRYYQA